MTLADFFTAPQEGAFGSTMVMTPYRIIRQRSASYPYFVGEGLLDAVGSIAGEIAPGKRVFLLGSEPIRSRFEQKVRSTLAREVPWISLPDGEVSKTVATAEAIVTRLLELGAKRDAVAVVVGGGMAGDTAGFAASIFLRGIDLVLVPTTLLAQVDSSVGGKVAVNHPLGKNLIGAFHPPIAVVADVSVLSSLPARELLSGVFESLKGGVIGDSALFELLASRRQDVLAIGPPVMEEIVKRSVDLKSAIVEEDEREGDRRRLLNYGHTIGHGIELALGYEGLTHGEAVAWGMIAANAIARRRGGLSQHDADRIDAVIRSYEPRAIPPIERKRVLSAVAHDKKFAGGKQVMVLPRRIGECVIVSDITDEEIGYGIDAIVG